MVFTLRSIAVAVQTIAAQERDRQKEQARQGKSFLLVTDRSSYRLLYQRGTSFDAASGDRSPWGKEGARAGGFVRGCRC
jgi:hypothetical protein